MKVTIDIPDELYETLRSRGTVVEELVARVLRDQARLPAPEYEYGQEPWRPAFGALADLSGELHRIQRVIDDEFERVNENTWR